VSVVTLENVKKDYRLGKTTIHALRGVSFTVEKGDFLSVVGPSGCGKTTLLNIIGCIDRPTEGTVLLHNQNVAELGDDEEAEKRLTKMGFIFQSFNLIPVLSVFENIEFPLILKKAPKQQRRERVKRIVEIVGLAEFAAHKPDELSGGQRQRVAIARALANDPEIIIADEPTANLDSETGGAILEEMVRLNREQNVTFVFSTHDPDIMRYAKRLVHLKDGAVDSIEAGQAR
jgi:putative ABC transport system ATP-binding protein